MMGTRAAQIAAAGIKRPVCWDDMGSSAKDLWEERTLARIERMREQAEQENGESRT